MCRRIVVIIALLTPHLLHALNNRSAVSINGLDTNPCTVASPCRSFAQALTVTSVSGEVVALNSGGYGGFQVFQDVTVEGAPGVYAGVTVASGDAVDVVTGNSVTLRNLVFNGLGTARYGVFFQSGGINHMENCHIENFSGIGLYSFQDVAVTDTTIRNVNAGIWLDNGGKIIHAAIINVTIADSASGVVALRNANATVRNTVSTNNGTGFETADAMAVLNMDSCVATRNETGVDTEIGGTARISNSFVTGNTTGVNVGANTVESWGNNKIHGNTTNVTGTMTPISQQ